VLLRLSIAAVVGLLAATALDLGFGPGFVDDAVAYPAVIYTCLLAAIVARTQGGAERPWYVHLLCNASLGAIVLVALRTVALAELPFGDYATTGHFPYVAVPLTTTIPALVWELLLLKKSQ
jgi:hypothetical protein